MLDENGQPIKVVGPSIPVEMGPDGTPDAGDPFVAVESERAREIADFRQEKQRSSKIARQQAVKLDSMFETMTAGEVQTLNIVIKATFVDRLKPCNHHCRTSATRRSR